MAWIADVVDGDTIPASWGNAVRNAVVAPHATAPARTSAVPAPTEGMVSYRSDDDVVEFYDGSTYYPVGWKPMKETVLTGTTASVSWTSIPQTYKHLMIIIDARSDPAVTYQNCYLRFNNDSGANYARLYTLSDLAMGSPTISSASSQSAGGGFVVPGASLGGASVFGGGVAWIRGYSSATSQAKHLSSVSSAGIATSIGARAWHMTWSPAAAAAINRIDLFPETGNWLTGSRFSLYGFGA